jgi:hypothetical protein
MALRVLELGGERDVNGKCEKHDPDDAGSVLPGTSASVTDARYPGLETSKRARLSEAPKPS